jgi:F-type H+-transporting ATPase subunit b
MQIISTIGLITINETLIVQLVSFLIFLFVINRVMFRPLRGVMDERDQYLDNIRMDISQSQNNLKDLQARIGEQEAEAKQEGFRMKEDLEKAGSDRADEMFAEAQQEMVTLRNEADQEIARQLENARQTVQQEAERLAADIMEKILDRRLPS